MFVSSGAENGSSDIKRRPRPILSCLECRRKKLKCDRQFPCNECKKTGRLVDCVFTHSIDHGSHAYDSGDPSPVANGGADRPAKRRRSTTSPDVTIGSAGLGVVEDLQLRVKRLEKLLDQGHDQRHSSVNAELPQPRTVKRVSNSIPYAHGENSHSSLISPFNDAKEFLLHFRDDPELRPYVERIKQIQENLAKIERAVRPPSLPKTQSAMLPQMTSVLPSKDICDGLVGSYLTNSEKTLRILHIPTFQENYRRYWETGRNEASVPHGFVPQLMAVLVTASEDSYKPFLEETNAPMCAMALGNIVEVWLSGLNRSERNKLSTMQTRTLLTKAQHNVFRPNDKIWTATGSLVRSAVSAQLHRDAVHFPDVSVFEGELRRRLWATIMEIDLQTSLLSGGPPAIRDNDYDTAPPALLDDSDLFDGMTELPKSRNFDSWRDSLLQVVLARSLPQRLRAVSFIKSLDNDAREEETILHGKVIEQLLHEIPFVARPDVPQNVTSDRAFAPSRMYGRIHLDLDIRRILLHLYRPYATNSSDPTTLFRARRVCRDSALAILSHQGVFEQYSADMAPEDAKRSRDRFETECRLDILLAALTLCGEIKMMNTPLPTDSTPATKHSEMSIHEAQYLETERQSPMPWTKARLIQVVEDALACLINMLDRPGSFLKYVLRLAVVLQSVRSNASLEKKMEQMRKVVISVGQTLIQRVEVEFPNISNYPDYSYPGATPMSLQGSAESLDADTVHSYLNKGLDNMESLGFDFGLGPDFDIGGFDFGFSSDWNLN